VPPSEAVSFNIDRRVVSAVLGFLGGAFVLASSAMSWIKITAFGIGFGAEARIEDYVPPFAALGALLIIGTTAWTFFKGDRPLPGYLTIGGGFFVIVFATIVAAVGSDDEFGELVEWTLDDGAYVAILGSILAMASGAVFVFRNPDHRH
jgi:hypothetical protein